MKSPTENPNHMIGNRFGLDHERSEVKSVVVGKVKVGINVEALQTCDFAVGLAYATWLVAGEDPKVSYTLLFYLTFH